MKLYSKVIGKGKPLLVLHGFLGMSDNWKTLGGEFAEEGYEVHLLDQRNHGRSPHSTSFDYEVMAADVKEYMDSKSISEAAVLGHSMGGKTAMTTACKYPDLVEKLVIVDIAPKYYAPHHQQILQGLSALNETALSSRQEADDLLKEYVEEPAVRMFLLKNLYRKSRAQLSLRMNLPVLIENIEAIGQALPEKSTFDKPTLFIKGGRSNYISNDDFQMIKSHFPQARIETIPGAGHWVHAEKKQRFFEVVMQFL